MTTKTFATCQLPLPVNFRQQDVLAFYQRDKAAVA